MNAEEAIRRIKEGDQSVFDEIYRDFRDPFLVWTCRKHGCSINDAKDIFQNAVLTFYLKVVNGEITELRSGVKTYLFGIGRNKGREWHRQEHKYAEEPTEYLLESILSKSRQNGQDYIEEEMLVVERALKVLGDPCKTLLELFYLQQMKMDAICELRGYKNSESVKTQKYKCMNRLRKIYKKELTKVS